MNKDINIICHVLSSIDGRIEGSMFSHQKIKKSILLYEEIYKEYNAEAIMAGTVTCSLTYANGYIKDLPVAKKEYDKKDNIYNYGLNKYFICIDAFGTLNFENNIVESYGEKGEIVVVLSKQVSNNYIQYLNDKNISYLFAGDKQLDVNLLITKLKDVLKINKCLVTGGGVLNWSLLQNQLIDELSIVIAPIAGAERDEPTIFDRSMFQDNDRAIAFDLLEVKQLKNNDIWLRYKPKYE